MPSARARAFRTLWAAEIFLGCRNIFGLPKYFWAAEIFLGCHNIFGLPKYFWAAEIFLGCHNIFGLPQYFWSGHHCVPASLLAMSEFTKFNDNQYVLSCPGCGCPMPTSLWFTAADNIDDDNGYLCCSTCINDFIKWSGVAPSKWQRMHTPAQWMRYPEQSWRISLVRSKLLRKEHEELGPKAAKAASSKSTKRKRPAAAAAARKQKKGEVVLPASVAAQMVATCTHADMFLDNLLAVANAQPPVQPVPQNVLNPDPVPQNVLSHFDPSVPQNVMSPFALAPINQNPVAPTTTAVLTGEDIRALSLSLDKMEELSQWTTTALGQMQSVQAVLRKILRR